MLFCIIESWRNNEFPLLTRHGTNVACCIYASKKKDLLTTKIRSPVTSSSKRNLHVYDRMAYGYVTEPNHSLWHNDFKSPGPALPSQLTNTTRFVILTSHEAHGPRTVLHLVDTSLYLALPPNLRTLWLPCLHSARNLLDLRNDSQYHFVIRLCMLFLLLICVHTGLRLVDGKVVCWDMKDVLGYNGISFGEEWAIPVTWSMGLRSPHLDNAGKGTVLG